MITNITKKIAYTLAVAAMLIGFSAPANAEEIDIIDFLINMGIIPAEKIEAARAFQAQRQGVSHQKEDTSLTCVNNLMPGLDISSKGIYVVNLQKELVKSGDLVMPAGAPMGYYGPLTANAVRSWQGRNNLPTTGSFDQVTYNSFQSNCRNISTIDKKENVNDDDISFDIRVSDEVSDFESREGRRVYLSVNPNVKADAYKYKFTFDCPSGVEVSAKVSGEVCNSSEGHVLKYHKNVKNHGITVANNKTSHKRVNVNVEVYEVEPDSGSVIKKIGTEKRSFKISPTDNNGVVIKTIYPNVVKPGSYITIEGTGFEGTTWVSFGSYPQGGLSHSEVVNKNNKGQLVVKVPEKMKHSSEAAGENIINTQGGQYYVVVTAEGAGGKSPIEIITIKNDDHEDDASAIKEPTVTLISASIKNGSRAGSGAEGVMSEFKVKVKNNNIAKKITIPGGFLSTLYAEQQETVGAEFSFTSIPHNALPSRYGSRMTVEPTSGVAYRQVNGADYYDVDPGRDVILTLTVDADTYNVGTETDIQSRVNVDGIGYINEGESLREKKSVNFSTPFENVAGYVGDVLGASTGVMDLTSREIEIVEFLRSLGL